MSPAAQVLEQIDEVLQSLGANKSNLLTARVLLSDAELFPDYDNAWNKWLDALRRPLRVWRPAEENHV